MQVLAIQISIEVLHVKDKIVQFCNYQHTLKKMDQSKLKKDS